jgi:hypothetical protein
LGPSFKVGAIRSRAVLAPAVLSGFALFFRVQGPLMTSSEVLALVGNRVGLSRAATNSCGPAGINACEIFSVALKVSPGADREWPLARTRAGR